MGQSATTIATQFELHTRLFNNVLDGIDDSQANHRASETVNHIKWLAGHLTATRYGMKDFGNVQGEDPYGEMFGHGKAIENRDDYPSLESIKSNWNAISGPIAEGLKNLPQEVLDGASPAQVPVNDETLGGFLTFLMHHEAYHIGQIGILRKYAGKDAMSYA